MQLFIISGRSGSGKTTVLQVFEDLDHYCVDNLPVSLIPELITNIESEETIDTAVIGIDARNLGAQLEGFPAILQTLKDRHITCTTLYLDADENTLLKRFSETRRKHPLSDASTSLAEAIAKEKAILYPIESRADHIIDTSHLSLHQLRDLIKGRITGNEHTGMSVLFYSFGFKHGLPRDADLVFDVRCLPNPYWISSLRQYTGLDEPVKEFLSDQAPVKKMIQDIQSFLADWLPNFEANNRSYMTVAIGCTGGQHRSVYVSESLCEHFKKSIENVQVRHRQLVK